MLTLSLALLIIVANGAPVVAGHLLGSRWARPVDGGKRWRDGRPVFGSSKTWRGVAAALLVTALLAWLLGMGWTVGLLVALGAMLGDLCSSFCKRRLGLASSAKATGLDQIPEALLPALLLRLVYGFDWLVLLLAAAIFVLVDVGLSPLLYRLGLRRVPH